MGAKTNKKQFHAMVNVWRARIGEEVRKRREALGEKQTAFGKRVYLSRAQISIIENGSRSYTVDPLIHVLSGFDADPVQSLLALTDKVNTLSQSETDTLYLVLELLSAEQDRELTTGVLEKLAAARSARRKPAGTEER